MSFGLLFWIIVLIGLLFWGGVWAQPNNPYWGRGWPSVLWVLLIILGWAVFGPPVHG